MDTPIFIAELFKKIPDWFGSYREWLDEMKEKRQKRG